MLLCGRTLLVVRPPQVFFPQTWTRTDFGNASRWPFSFPNLNFVPRASWEFYGVSRRSIQSRVRSFPQNRLLWISILRYTTLDSFFLSQNRNCSLSTLFLRLLAGLLLTISMSIQATIAINASVSRLVITIFYILPPHRQGILAPVAGLASRLFERLSSVCPFPVGTQEDACSSPFRLRSLSTAGLRPDTLAFSTSSAVVSRFPEARECRKLQDSPFEQDPFAFHWKHSPVFRLAKEFCSFPLVTATRSVISLWILKCLLLWACSICNFTHNLSLW